MIKQIKFKTNSKSLCYYIPNADIESGAEEYYELKKKEDE